MEGTISEVKITQLEIIQFLKTSPMKNTHNPAPLA